MDRRERIARGRYLVTGGAGFIGSNLVRHIRARFPASHVTVLDKLTYAGNPANLAQFEGGAGYTFIRGDICDRERVRQILSEGYDWVLNFAAETHVDRSIGDPGQFVLTDMYGVYGLLEAVRQFPVVRFVQISTDEVYGEVFGDAVNEDAPLLPRNPYAASKAGGDRLAHAYYATYGLPVVITRCCNNYGPYQYPEKLIPLCILNALHGDPLPVYGDGMQVRNWLHVSDHCSGLQKVLLEGRAGETYNIGGPDELPNMEVVQKIIELTGADESLIEHVTDRPGHDVRYSLSSGKTIDLGWEARIAFESGLRETVEWYRESAWWWEPIRSGDYQDYYERQYGQKLGS